MSSRAQPRDLTRYKHLLCLPYALLLAALLAGCAHTPPAHQYPPGTVGYLVEDCRATMQKSTPDGFVNSRCFDFNCAYILGGFIDGMKNHNPPRGDRESKASNPACEQAVDAEQKQIKDKMFCTDSDGDKRDTRFFVPFAYIISEWGEWLQYYDRDTLNKPVFPNILQAIHNGPQCEFLYDSNRAVYRPNKNLWESGMNGFKDWKGPKNNFQDKINWLFDESTSSPEQYKNCIKDIEYASDNTAVFIGTECGMIFAGFLSGLFISDAIDDEPAKNDPCANDINRLRKHLITAKDACLSKNLDILDFVKKWLAGFEYDAAKDQITRKKNFSFDYCQKEK